MATVTKGSNRQARRQPGQASNSIRKTAPSDMPPKAGMSSRKGAPGNPRSVTGMQGDLGSNMAGHGNAGLSGVDDKQ